MNAALKVRAPAGATHPSSALRIEVAPSLDHFARIWPTSGSASAARYYPFQQADVLRIWYETIGRGRSVEPMFAGVFLPNGKPAFLLPLVLERSGGVTVLRFPDYWVSDYNAPVVFPDAVEALPDTRKVWEQLVRNLPPFDLAVLEKMPNEVGGLPNPLASLATAEHPESGHGVTLQGPWEDFARERLPRWSDSRRCLRNLQKLGHVEFKVASGDRERSEFLSALFCQKRRRFIETNAADIFDHPGVSEFYRRTSEENSGCNTIVSALTLDGRVLAANWGLRVGDRYYDLMTSNEGGEFRTYAPGRLHNEWLLLWGIENGVRVSDFGIGDEAYKFRYCDMHTPLRDAYIPVTTRGAWHSRSMMLQNAAKDILRGTMLGTALKVVRDQIQKMTASRPVKACPPLPAWLALIGSVTLAVDA